MKKESKKQINSAGQVGLHVASAKSEDEHRSRARRAGSPSDLLSRAPVACRALTSVQASPRFASPPATNLSRASFYSGGSDSPRVSRSLRTSRASYSLRSLSGLLLLIPLAVVLLCSAAPAGAVPVVHGVDDVLANYTYQIDGKLYFASPAGQRWELITDVNDPEIINKGDGSFHPVNGTLVDEALAQISYRLSSVPVQVFILPYPRRGLIESSASPGEVFLSPGVLECSAEVVHFTISHELGHIVHRRFMPDENGELWTRYKEIRGITDPSVYSTTAVHKNRPNEIFAEDFRFLFGGVLANYSGTIENGSLTLPSSVPGLREFMLSLAGRIVGPDNEAESITLNSFPNPFNPVLNVNFTVGFPLPELTPRFSSAPAVLKSALSKASSAGSDISQGRILLRIFDVNGRLVKTLLNEEYSTGTHSAVWSGDDEQGRVVSSGIYFLKLDAGQETLTKKVILSR